MLVSGIQNHPLEVTVVGCNKLKDTEWISRQDPYICLEYGSAKFRTRTCTDGGKTPTFQEKFVFSLIEGLREINIAVWNSNTLTHDDFIGNGKFQLQKVLTQGYDDSAWPLQTKTGRYAGEVRLILHYANAIHAAKASAPLAPPYVAPQVPPYSVPPPAYAASYPHPASAAYPPPVTAYPSSSPSLYPPQPAAYPPPPSAYPSPPPPSTYPSLPVPSAYAPPSYPPSSPYYPPGHFYPGPSPPPSYKG